MKNKFYNMHVWLFGILIIFVNPIYAADELDIILDLRVGDSFAVRQMWNIDMDYHHKVSIYDRETDTSTKVEFDNKVIRNETWYIYYDVTEVDENDNYWMEVTRFRYIFSQKNEGGCLQF